MSGSTLKVLAVEDNEADARLLEHELRKAGFVPVIIRVQTEDDYLAHLLPPPDVILCDYNLPQFNALRALEILRQNRLETPLIIVSGSIGEDLAVQAVRLGACDYLQKDRLGRLGTAVNQVLAQRRLQDAERRARLAEQESINRLNLALDATGIGVWQWDLKSDRIYWSPRCYEIFNNPSFGGTFADFQRLLHPDDAEQVLDSIATAIATERSFSSEFRIIGPDGHIRWLSHFGRAEFSSSGVPFSVAGTVQEITQRKQNEILIAESEARFRETLDNMLEGCQILDKELRYLYLNASAAHHGRTTREKLLGKRMIEVYPGVEQTQMFAALSRCLELRTPLKMTNEFDFPDGTKGTFELSIQPVPQGILILTMEITDRMHAEQALQASEARYRTLVESLPQLVWMTDSQGQITYLNRRFFEYSGVQSPHLCDWSWPAVIHPDDQLETTSRWIDALQSGQDLETEYRLRRHDGEYRWHMVRGIPLRNGQGQISNWFGTCTDMHDLKRAEAALRESEERLSMCLQAANEGIWDYDLQSGSMWWNHTYEDILGEQPAGQASCIDWWQERLHPDDRRHVHEELMAALAGQGQRWTSEYRIRRADGSYAEIYDRAIIARSPDGSAKRVLGAMLDLTERRRAEVLLRTVMRTVPDAILTVTDSGKINSVNPATEQLFGYMATELIGKDVRMLEAGDDAVLEEPFGTSSGESGDTHRELQYQHRSGSVFPAELTVTDFRLEDRAYHTYVIRDVSERKKLEAQFLQSHKMEAVGQLAGGVAHDFNNILMVISGYCELLTDQMDKEDPRRTALLAINDAGNRAAGLTRQLLAFSRQQILEPTLIQLNDLVNRAQVLLRRLIREDISVTVRMDPAIPQIKADAVQIDQVLLNLVVNARDAMPDGGSLLIETSRCEVLPDQKRIDEEIECGSYVRLAITDTGCGIPKCVQSRIFEPFFTTKAVGKGTGLGLSVVHGIVKQSGGQIRVLSEEGVGTTFEILLPAHVSQRPTKEAIAGLQTEDHGSETVLLVEDEPAVREIARHILESRGYQVLEAPNGVTALDVATRYSRSIHLLLTDMVMPEMGGRQLAEIMRLRQPDVRVLFMSVYTDDVQILHRAHDARDTLIQKPFTPKALARRVRETLDKPHERAPRT